MNTQNSVLNTLKYSSIFNFPLTAKEIYKYLLSNRKTSYKKIEISLKSLVKSKKIKKEKEYFFLSNLSRDVVKKRIISESRYKEIIKYSKKELSILNKIPFLKLVGVTGSVAAKNINKSSDVDLFLICAKNAVWITRLLVTLFFKFTKNYRSPYCPNIYISEDRLLWKDQNLYVANDLVRLVPIFNKSNTYEKLLVKNHWIINFLPNMEYYLPKLKLNSNSNFLYNLLFPLEVFFYVIQKLYMQRNITTERVSLKRILFIKNDYTNKVLSEYKNET